MFFGITKNEEGTFGSVKSNIFNVNFIYQLKIFNNFYEDNLFSYIDKITFMHAKLKQQISPCRKKKKRYSHKKLLSEKSTTIEKSICPFSLLYTYLYKKYLEDQEKK